MMYRFSEVLICLWKVTFSKNIYPMIIENPKLIFPREIYQIINTLDFKKLKCTIQFAFINKLEAYPFNKKFLAHYFYRYFNKFKSFYNMIHLFVLSGMRYVIIL